jgi:hypothetical protein
MLRHSTEAPPAVSFLEHLDPDRDDAPGQESQPPGCPLRQVDDRAFAVVSPVGAAVDDAHHDRPPVPEIGDARDGAERQVPVRRHHLALIERLAAGRFLAMEAGPVVRGQAPLDARLPLRLDGPRVEQQAAHDGHHDDEPAPSPASAIPPSHAAYA